MSCARKYWFSLFFLALCVCCPAIGQKVAPKRNVVPANKGNAKTKTKTYSVQLPDAYSGEVYSEKIAGNFGLATGQLTCPSPPLPDGLTFTCGPDLTLSGTANTSAPESVSTVVVITDVLNRTVKLDLTFRLLPAKGTVIVGAAKLPAATLVQSSPPDFSKESFLETQPIVEGASEIKGVLTPSLGSYTTKLNVRVWNEQNGGPAFVAQLKPGSGASSTSPVLQQPLNSDSTYDLTLINALTAGEKVHLALLDATGKEVLLQSPVNLSEQINMPIGVGLQLTSEIVASATTISGRVNMPVPPIKPDSSATPPSSGNYPQIVIWVRDPDINAWSQAPLVSSSGASTTILAQSVSADGTFAVTLKNPLKSGQTVRVEAIAPPGRSFSSTVHFAQTRKVTSVLVLIQPSISTVLTEGVTTLSGYATAPGTGTSVSVAVLDLGPTSSNSGAHSGQDTSCIMADELVPPRTANNPRLLPLTSSGSNVLIGSLDAQTGAFKLSLAEALKEGDRIQIVQVLPADTIIASPQTPKCRSSIYTVRYAFDWDRTNVTFVAGVLISNSSSGSATSANFSQANQFYSINVDHAWRLPGEDCVPWSRDDPRWQKPKQRDITNDDLRGDSFGRREYGRCKAFPAKAPFSDDVRAHPGWRSSRWPGTQTYFDGRLTAIPVSAAAASPTQTSTTSGGTTGGGSSGSSGGPSTSTSNGSTSTILTSQKVFRVSTGLFLPWVVARGVGDHPTGLFVGPLAKAGFDTVTGASSQPDVVLPDGTTGTLNYQRAYNFFAFGGRLGNLELSASADRAPKIDHYLDVTIGRYTNLQSFVCHQLHKGQTSNALPGSSCVADYPQFFPDVRTVAQSRKELFRLDFEGLIKIPIPATLIPFYVGFNANISQHTVGSQGLDHGYAPPDDIRILFGTKIDIGSLLSSLSLGSH